MQRNILIGICCIFLLLKFRIPGLSADSIWSVSQAFAFMRGSFWSDDASGFYMPGLGSVLLTIWFKIFGTTEVTLKLWYIFLKIVSFLFLVKRIRRDQDHSWVPVLLSVLVLFDPYLSPERMETFALFAYMLGDRFIPESRIKIYIMSIILWWAHPVAGLFYGIIQIDSYKKISVLLIPVLLMVFLLGESMRIWLQTLFVRLQPEAMWEQFKALKFILMLQISGGMILYRSGLLRPYFKKFMWVLPILFLAGKPYYFFWVQLLLVLHLAKVPKQFFTGYRSYFLSGIGIISIYITTIFPWLETRVLNPDYAEMYQQSVEYRLHMKTPDFSVPELALPFLQKSSPVRLVSVLNIESKLHRAEEGATALTYIKRNRTDTPLDIIPAQNYIQYHLWLLPADTFETGLFLYRAQK